MGSHWRRRRKKDDLPVFPLFQKQPSLPEGLEKPPQSQTSGPKKFPDNPIGIPCDSIAASRVQRVWHIFDIRSRRIRLSGRGDDMALKTEPFQVFVKTIRSCSTDLIAGRKMIRKEQHHRSGIGIYR